MPRVDWTDLPPAIHTAVRRHTGPISRVDPVGPGRNSDLAAVVHAAAGPVFAKGNPADGRAARTQHLEAAIAPHVTAVSPRLLWRVTAAGWDVLGFEHVAGRRADLSPGSADLEQIAAALARLAATPPPGDVPLARIEHRWREYGDPDELRLLAGDTLLHTDLHADNILISAAGARIVDWSWPTLGAAWVEPACLAVWLIAAGHTPAAAEEWAAGSPSWAAASPEALNVFAAAAARLWVESAEQDPGRLWKTRVAAAAAAWEGHRARRT